MGYHITVLSVAGEDAFLVCLSIVNIMTSSDSSDIMRGAKVNLQNTIVVNTFPLSRAVSYGYLVDQLVSPGPIECHLQQRPRLLQQEISETWIVPKQNHLLSRI